MPRKACTVCGGAALAGRTRCALHPLQATRNQQRDYRGLAIYRQTLAAVIERDAAVCHVCGQPGADSIDHYPTAYADLPRDPDGKVPVDVALDESNLRAAHLGCNRSRGRGRPEGRTR